MTAELTKCAWADTLHLSWADIWQPSWHNPAELIQTAAELQDHDWADTVIISWWCRHSVIQQPPYPASASISSTHLCLMYWCQAYLNAALGMGTYAVVPVRISHRVSSDPAVIEELHSVAGFRIEGCTAYLTTNWWCFVNMMSRSANIRCSNFQS